MRPLRLPLVYSFSLAAVLAVKFALAAAANLPDTVSGFSVPSCLPQVTLPLRAAAASAPAMAASGAQLSRREAIGLGAAGAAAWVSLPKGASAAKPAAEDEEEDFEYSKLKDGEGLEYAVLEAGKGAKAKVGDLVAIRFKATYNGVVIDDCFKTPNAYYYRVGSESVIRGLDLAVRNMKLGDRWALKIPSNLAFGDKGVKPSPGKPRIPGGATLDYEIFFETYPGAEDDLLEVNGENN